jgi:hypothetical protein
MAFALFLIYGFFVKYVQYSESSFENHVNKKCFTLEPSSTSVDL